MVYVHEVYDVEEGEGGGGRWGEGKEGYRSFDHLRYSKGFPWVSWCILFPRQSPTVNALMRRTW